MYNTCNVVYRKAAYNNSVFIKPCVCLSRYLCVYVLQLVTVVVLHIWAELSSTETQNFIVKVSSACYYQALHPWTTMTEHYCKL